MSGEMVSAEARGIPFVFDVAALDDFEVLELLSRMREGDPLAAVPFARTVFGSEQLENIKDSLRGEDGRCRSSDMIPWIFDALEAAASKRGAEAKN